MITTGIAMLLTVAVWIGLWEGARWIYQDRGVRVLFVCLVATLTVSLILRDHNNRAPIEAWFDFFAAAGLFSWLIVS